MSLVEKHCFVSRIQNACAVSKDPLCFLDAEVDEIRVRRQAESPFERAYKIRAREAGSFAYVAEPKLYVPVIPDEIGCDGNPVAVGWLSSEVAAQRLVNVRENFSGCDLSTERRGVRGFQGDIERVQATVERVTIIDYLLDVEEPPVAAATEISLNLSKPFRLDVKHPVRPRRSCNGVAGMNVTRVHDGGGTLRNLPRDAAVQVVGLPMRDHADGKRFMAVPFETDLSSVHHGG